MSERNPFLDRCLNLGKANMSLRSALQSALISNGALARSTNRLMLAALSGWGLALALLLGWQP